MVEIHYILLYAIIEAKVYKNPNMEMSEIELKTLFQGGWSDQGTLKILKPTRYSLFDKVTVIFDIAMSN